MNVPFIPSSLSWMASTEKRQRGIQSKAASKSSELPQHGNCSADAYIVVVEIAKPSKGQRCNCHEACLGSLLQCIPRNVVSDHLSKAPVTVQGEGCGQRVVHHRAGNQVPSWKQAQEQNTDNPLSGPVESCQCFALGAVDSFMFLSFLQVLRIPIFPSETNRQA